MVSTVENIRKNDKNDNRNISSSVYGRKRVSKRSKISTIPQQTCYNKNQTIKSSKQSRNTANSNSKASTNNQTSYPPLSPPVDPISKTDSSVLASTRKLMIELHHFPYVVFNLDLDITTHHFPNNSALLCAILLEYATSMNLNKFRIEFLLGTHLKKLLPGNLKMNPKPYMYYACLKVDINDWVNVSSTKQDFLKSARLYRKKISNFSFPNPALPLDPMNQKAYDISTIGYCATCSMPYAQSLFTKIGHWCFTPRLKRGDLTRDCLLYPLGHDTNENLCRRSEFWTKVQAICKTISCAAPKLDFVALNFGSWETALSKNPVLQDCHAHAHLCLSAEAQNAMLLSYPVLRGRYLPPKEDYELYDMHTLSDQILILETELLRKNNNNMSSRISRVETKIETVASELQTSKTDLTAKIDTVASDLKAFKSDLTTKIDNMRVMMLCCFAVLAILFLIQTLCTKSFLMT